MLKSNLFPWIIAITTSIASLSTGCGVNNVLPEQDVTQQERSNRNPAYEVDKDLSTSTFMNGPAANNKSTFLDYKKCMVIISATVLTLGKARDIAVTIRKAVGILKKADDAFKAGVTRATKLADALAKGGMTKSEIEVVAWAVTKSVEWGLVAVDLNYPGGVFKSGIDGAIKILDQIADLVASCETIFTDITTAPISEAIAPLFDSDRENGGIKGFKCQCDAKCYEDVAFGASTIHTDLTVTLTNVASRSECAKVRLDGSELDKMCNKAGKDGYVRRSFKNCVWRR